MSSVFDLIDQEEFSEPTTINKIKEKKPVEDTVFEMEESEEPVQVREESQSWMKSIPIDILKGILEASSKIGRMMGPLQEETVGEYRKTESQRQKELSEGLNKILPSDETFSGSTLRRALNVGGPAMAFPGGATVGMATRSGLAGLFGQTLQDIGAPEGLQTAAEIGAFLSPGFGKQIIPLKRHEEIANFLRSQGASEEEIAPLLQGKGRKIFGMEIPSKEEVLAKVSEKGKKGTERIKSSQDRLGKIYENLSARPEASTVLTNYETSDLISKIEDKLDKMPSHISDSIKKDFEKFKNGLPDGKSIMEFWHKINKNPNRRDLGILKQPLKESLELISPNLNKDFEMTNKLYQGYLSINKSLKPSDWDRFWDFSKYPRIMYGMFSGNYPVILEAAGEKGGRVLARELLTNPRLQTLTKQSVKALKEGKYAIANRLKDQISSLLEEELPDISTKINDFNFEQMEE